jgi:uncharacterized protein YbaR (Trm112 family)
MNSSTWQIEHACTQCGAPLVLEETERLLTCPFCRTRLYLVAENHFHYYIRPTAATDKTLFYLPYWRLRGSSYSIRSSEVSQRFVDTNTLGVNCAGLPRSLGLRPQVMRLRFVSPSMEGRLISPDLTLAEAISDLGGPTQDLFYHNFIGETASLLYAPFYIERSTLYDAILDRPVDACETKEIDLLVDSSLPPQGQVRFIPTLCPGCGWDMEGEKDSLVLICRNCNSAWACTGNTFQQVEFTVIPPPAGVKESTIYLPFWRMKPRIAGMDLSSYADLIRMANLPKAITPAFEEMPLFFWSPSFKVNPSLYSRWARQMTIFRPSSDCEENTFPKADFYPVTLSLTEAAEAIIITIAHMIIDKRRLYPKLADIDVRLQESRLEYHPFILNHGELFHALLNIALDRTALEYGVGM